MQFPIAGSCRCGRVTMRISAPPLLTMACHCTGCQRMASSAFSLSAAIPDGAFAVTQGEPVIGGLHGEAEHYFCPYCMSWMFTKMAGMGFVNVRSPLLDGAARFAPFVETWTSEALPFAKTGATHSYATLPRDDEYPGLIAAYAARDQGSL